MNNKIIFALLVLLTVALSVTAISASDVNVTDSYTANLVDDSQDISVPVEKAADISQDNVSDDSNVVDDSSKVSLSSDEVLESEDSNNLSTSIESDDLLSKESGTAVLTSENTNYVSSDIDLSKTIQAKDITKYYKGTAKYTATFYDKNGKALAHANVKITVNGKTYTRTTDANGLVSLAINLKPGTYKVIAKNPETGYQLTTNFKILSTISAKSISKVYTDSRKFSAKFYKSNGKVLANKYVKFKINGKTYKKKTNAKGVASLSLKSLKKGTHKIISYNSDGLTKTNKIKVYNRVKSKLVANPYIFLKKTKSKVIKVKLLNSLGYAPSAGKLIKIRINGKTYNRYTKSSRIASLKLPVLKAGLYTVKYSFAGTSRYKASSASTKVAIITTKNVKFTVKSGTTFTKGSKNTFKVLVKAGTVPLPGKKVAFTVAGKKYTKTTNNNGIASLGISALGVGKHVITYAVTKTVKNNAKKGSTTVTVKDKDTSRHAGYWLFGADMKSVNLKNLYSKGVTDIFLNFKAYELYGKSGVESWISSAKTYGINVHMWVQAFYTGSWVNPVKNGKENTAYFNQKIKEFKTYAAIKGLAGIHMDYLRYPGNAYKTSGGTAAISSFTKQVRDAIKAVNNNLVLSAAIMPETTVNAYYYGQNYAALTKYLDVVVPMIYKGNYNQNSAWIATTTKWFVSNSKGAQVWSGLQAYVSDDNPTKLPLAQLTTDVRAALNGGAAGVMLFRWGVSNDINFNTVFPAAAGGDSISLKDVVAAADNVKTYYSFNGKLPDSVVIEGFKFTMPEFMYLVSKTVVQLGAGNIRDVQFLCGVAAPSSPSGDTINSAQLKTYVHIANDVVDFILNNKQAPNYVLSDVGKIIYSELIDAFSRVVSYYGSHNQLPSNVTISYRFDSGAVPNMALA